MIITTAANYRKTYCNNNEYIPRGDRYPHLHCGSNFFLLSISKNNHKYFGKGTALLCGNVKQVLADPSYFYNNNSKITVVLQHFQRQECPKNINIESPKDNNPQKKSRKKREL